MGVFPYESHVDHDYLSYGFFSGQVCHGHNACVKCMDDTTHCQLLEEHESSKTMFMVHQRWLPKDGMWRRHGDLFNGEDDIRGPTRKRSSIKIDMLLKNWEERLASQKKRKGSQSLLEVWKTRSIFWDLW
jgi:hypothetical protein